MKTATGIKPPFPDKEFKSELAYSQEGAGWIMGLLAGKGLGVYHHDQKTRPNIKAQERYADAGFDFTVFVYGKYDKWVQVKRKHNKVFTSVKNFRYPDIMLCPEKRLLPFGEIDFYAIVDDPLKGAFIVEESTRPEWIIRPFPEPRYEDRKVDTVFIPREFLIDFDEYLRDVLLPALIVPDDG